MSYQHETFSIPKISVNGTFRLNIGSLVKKGVADKLPALKSGLLFFLSSVGSFFSGLGARASGSLSNFNFKKFLPIAVFALFVIGTGYLAYRRIAPGGFSGSEIKVKGAKAMEDANKEYSFPLIDADGNEVSRFKFVVEKVELRDEIIVQGKRATSVSGRTFLVVNLKITNEYNQRIEINTRDFVRLATSLDKTEWLAPDIHNDPVEVQAISTKYTRVGFAINDSDKDLTLRIGEINGDKEEIALSLNK